MKVPARSASYPTVIGGKEIVCTIGNSGLVAQSKMHRIVKMDIREISNEYVDDIVLENLQKWIDMYNTFDESSRDESGEGSVIYIGGKSLTKADIFQRIISNTPMGLQLTARITDNYLQIKGKVGQRRHHKLEEWQAYCDWAEKLPLWKELVLGEFEPLMEG